MNTKSASLSRLSRLSLRSLSSLLLVACAALGGCSTAALSPAGSHVAVARNAPAPDCTAVGYLVGEGGGTFGGGWVSNDSLIDYAMNDLRNKAAERGATYVQSDPPQMGTGKGTTTTVTVTGTAYVCGGKTS